MLISFSLENWMSFREKVTLSMVASRERQHSSRVTRLDKYKSRILPIAAIYGGNASGKSNLLKAMTFARGLIVKGTQPDDNIPVNRFALDSTCNDSPTKFSFIILADENVYSFSFSITQSNITDERLSIITSTSERQLYYRIDGKPTFDSTLSRDDSLKFAFKGTRDNQLFLTNTISQKIDTFKPVFNWFRNNLRLISPSSHYEPFEKFIDEDQPLYSTMNQMLAQLDTGITRLGGENIPIDSIPLIPESLRSKIQENVKEGETVRLMTGVRDERFLLTRQDGDLTAKKLVSYHQKSDGTEAKFEFHQESDGTQRIINLLPAILDLASASSRRVYFIDEIDRSLHTLLTRKLLSEYLNRCSLTSSMQLLFTTHDILLMDQNLLRRDEMWVTERSQQGVSTLFSFSDYKDIRYDKDIRKSYLQGRLGGIPKILLNDLCPL